MTRRRLTSTTTVFFRPWLKLCWTWPDSTVRLIPSGLRPSTGLSSLLSLIDYIQPSRFSTKCGMVRQTAAYKSCPMDIPVVRSLAAA